MFVSSKNSIKWLCTLLLASAVIGCGGGDNSSSNIPPPASGPALGIFAGVFGATGSVNGPVGSAQFNTPYGIAPDAAGNLYVVDNGNLTVRKISAGIVSTIAGTPGEAGSADGIGAAGLFDCPQQIAVDDAGNLYITDQTASGAVTVRKVTADGQVSTIVDPATGTALVTNGSVGIAVDHAYNVYIFATRSTTNANTLTQITQSGTVNSIALQGLAGNSISLVYPQNMAVDSANNVYISDVDVNGNAGVLYKVAITGTTGKVTTLAGSLASAGSNDGPGSSATFNGLFNLVVDQSGNIYANDTGNATIREISDAGVVSTLAGKVGQYGVGLGPLPGLLPDIGGLALVYQTLYIGDQDDNVILQVAPLP